MTPADHRAVDRVVPHRTLTLHVRKGETVRVVRASDTSAQQFKIRVVPIEWDVGRDGRWRLK